MQSVPVKIVGISGSPIRGGNCDIIVQAALESAAQMEGVETEFITLADKKIAACIHCQYCVEHRVPCKFKDDANEIIDTRQRPTG